MRLHGLFKNAHPGVNANTYMQYNSVKLVEENKYEIGSKLRKEVETMPGI